MNDLGDVLLTGYRIVPILAGGAASSGGAAVTVPATTLPGTYRVIACADAGVLVKESNEANNCAVSVTAVVVGWPDLVASAVSDPPASALVGTAFGVTDTVQNAGAVNSAVSVVRYYLSLDAVKDAGDVLLTGYRIVPLLAAGAVSSGGATVRVPAATLPGMYRVFACADGGSIVKESKEANNCTASATMVAVR